MSEHRFKGAAKIDDTPEVISLRGKKPDWLRVKAPSGEGYRATRELVRSLALNTVCEEAACPNIGECWAKGHATVMLLGRVCTRACGFCNIATGLGDAVDPNEPARVAAAVERLRLRHVVLTSVDRDDLDDGGARHFVETIKAIRKQCSETTVEVLTPDFRRKQGSIELVADARPDVYNHNLETVSRLYRRVRPGASYDHSLKLLARVKRRRPSVFTKSGIMLGLGENRDEVLEVMDHLRAVGCDFITIGQYLRPSKRNLPVERYVHPSEFSNFEKEARDRGFYMVSASPMTRSSYHADADFEKLQENRLTFGEQSSAQFEETA